MEEIRQKILIDTDIGDDIDDAFALAFAVNSPELELVGVTTVFRNCRLRAKMARALLDSYGKGEIPVCAGVDIPLLQSLPTGEGDVYDETGRMIPCQYQKELMDGYCYSQEWGPDFIIRMVREHPHEIVLVPIGPLTNIAIAIRKCPEIVPLIRKIVLMGGMIHGDTAEWNILCDPEAARIVYTSGAELYAVGLDVTLQCVLSAEQVERFGKLSDKGSVVLGGMLRKWMAHVSSGTPILHDPLTVGCVIDPTFVGCGTYQVSVELEGEGRGRTVIAPGDARGASIHVAETVEKDRYLDFFQRRIIG